MYPKTGPTTCLLSYFFKQQELALGGGLGLERRALHMLSTHYSTGLHSQLTSRNLLLLLLSLCLSMALTATVSKYWKSLCPSLLITSLTITRVQQDKTSKHWLMKTFPHLYQSSPFRSKQSHLKSDFRSAREPKCVDQGHLQGYDTIPQSQF